MGTIHEVRREAKIKKFRTPPRPKGVQYKHLRPREDLTYDEVMRLIKAAEHVGRNRLRDGTMTLMAYVHAMRAIEICQLKWAQIDLSGRNPRIKVIRVKGSKDSDHPLDGEEVRRLRKLDAQSPDSQYVFAGETGNPLSVQGLWQIVRRAGQVAGLPFSIHPHMLRHTCGQQMLRDGVHLRLIQAWMGHEDVKHTEHYTRVGTERFQKISLLRRGRKAA
ncbi:MAG: tyrosine-type recombinase/integrase [Gammaproteobacteria bacterium]